MCIGRPSRERRHDSYGVSYRFAENGMADRPPSLNKSSCSQGVHIRTCLKQTSQHWRNDHCSRNCRLWRRPCPVRLCSYTRRVHMSGRPFDSPPSADRFREPSPYFCPTLSLTARRPTSMAYRDLIEGEKNFRHKLSRLRS